METISAARRICRRSGQVARPTGSQQEQKALCPAGNIANGFLKHRFLPLYQPVAGLPDKNRSEKVFFKSLAVLADRQGLSPMDVKGQPYPYNIVLAYRDALRQLNQKNQEVELSILEDAKGAVRLSTKQRYETGSTLYFIPVVPLGRLLGQRARRQEAELMLSVFSYLFHVVHVPYYRDDCTDLYSHYEMIKEWMAECSYEWEEADACRNFSDWNAAEYYGDWVQRKIWNACHLNEFKHRIDRFNPVNAQQRDCLKVASTAYALWQQYPKRTLFDHIHPIDDEQDAGVIRADQYVSFIANTEGWVYNSLSQSVNDIFNECGEMEEPTVEQLYTSRMKKVPDDLGFEQQLFPLIIRLCEYLNDLP